MHHARTLLALGLAAFAAAATAQDTPKRGGTLVYAVNAEPPGCLEERLWMRLAVRHIIGGHQHRRRHQLRCRDPGFGERHGTRRGDRILGPC